MVVVASNKDGRMAMLFATQYGCTSEAEEPPIRA